MEQRNSPDDRDPDEAQPSEHQPSEAAPQAEGEHCGRDYTSHLIGYLLDADGNPRLCEWEGCDNVITTTNDSWSSTYCTTHRD